MIKGEKTGSLSYMPTDNMNWYVFTTLYFYQNPDTSQKIKQDIYMILQVSKCIHRTAFFLHCGGHNGQEDVIKLLNSTHTSTHIQPKVLKGLASYDVRSNNELYFIYLSTYPLFGEGGLNLALTDKKGKVKSYTSTILFKYFWDFHVMYIKLWKDKLWVYGILFNFVNFSPNIQGIIQNSTKN